MKVEALDVQHFTGLGLFYLPFLYFYDIPKAKSKLTDILITPFRALVKLEDGTCDANSIPCWIRGDNERSNKKTDTVIVTKQPPLMPRNYSGPDHSETRRGRKLACCTGLSMDLLIELMKDLNFEVELYEVYDRLWGGWTKDGWNGLVRELMDQKADMAITSLKITPNRSEQIDFSVPFLETGIAITVALREGAISPTAFLEPYDYQCWCIILLFSVHASGAAIYLYEWLSPVGQDRGRLITPDISLVIALFNYETLREHGSANCLMLLGGYKSSASSLLEAEESIAICMEANSSPN
ncbi:unnamed protein product [Rodentolepis nana]|uniref:Lig_chan-Glu_bd domain-containing protein n=1 Tax=Rodentolepis nana TaxID=102285 RepID=A0A0R3TS64_RODNA|nr:unnamed protein product [Rodentolepis nana]